MYAFQASHSQFDIQFIKQNLQYFASQIIENKFNSCGSCLHIIYCKEIRANFLLTT